MSVITLKFTHEMGRASTEDRKHCTSRDERKGEIGDTFETDGTWFVLTGVLPLPLYRIGLDLYMTEGFDSPQDCIRALRTIYPYKGPDDMLYTHFYRRSP